MLLRSYSLLFSYFYNGLLYSDGLPINVTNVAKNLTINTTTDKKTYTKNDLAQLTIKTTDNTGQPVSANVSVSIVDDNIFNLRASLPNGPIYWNFYSPRMDTTNFSASTLGIGTGGGCGGGGGSDIVYIPNRIGNTYYWNPNLLTDQNGELNISVPVASASGNLRVFVTSSSNDSAVGQSQSSLSVE